MHCRHENTLCDVVLHRMRTTGVGITLRDNKLFILFVLHPELFCFKSEPGMCLFHQKKRGKVDNNLSIKRKLILFAINSIRFLFLSFLEVFPCQTSFKILFHFIPVYRDVAFIWEKICPGVPRSRLLQPGFRYTGTSRSPYKRSRENNSKLSTSQDPGTPGRPSIPGSYKQALR